MISNFIVQNWLEITAVIFAILYLILAVKQNILCWTAGIISSVLYFFIMQKAGLYMEAGYALDGYVEIIASESNSGFSSYVGVYYNDNGERT